MKRPSAETLYYGLSFGLRMPTWVVMAVYLVRTLHLSPLQLVLMGTAMEGAVFLFEVPTGVVADTYSRKLSLIIGYLGMGTATAAVGFVSTPWIAIVLWALWGIAYTFTSGAEEAWVADECGSERVGRIFLRAARYGQAGAVVGLLLQVAVGVASLRAGVVLGGAFTIACGLACVVLMEEHGFERRPREERHSPFREMRTTAAAGARYARAAPVIVLLVTVGVFAGMSSEGFDRLKEAHFLRDIGLPAVGHLSAVVWFGLFYLVGMAIGFVGTTFLIRRFERDGSETIASALLASRSPGRPGQPSRRSSASSSRATLPTRFTRSGSTSRSPTRASAQPFSRSAARRTRSASRPAAPSSARSGTCGGFGPPSSRAQPRWRRRRCSSRERVRGAK
ncbi:MAG TPA: MFS transporter [Gaiellaceae bacterium]|nr:MFS transporter [Gaiellaceae bacterium]